MSTISLNLATKENPQGTEAWIIESHRDLGVPKYWAGYYFTDNIEDAVQFKRHKDGEKVIHEQFSMFKAYFCILHKWM